MGKNGHFKRFNALYDLGYVATLSALEMRVWWAFERHANQHDKTWPSIESISANLGVGERNIRRAIASLVKLGMLTAGKAGCGRGCLMARTMSVPKNRAQGARFSDIAETPFPPPEDEEKPGAGDQVLSTEKPGAGEHENRAQETMFPEIKPGARGPENRAQEDRKTGRPAPDEGPMKVQRREKDKQKGGEAASPRGDAGFDLFWDAWPKHFRKVGRDKCKSLWGKRKLSEKSDRVIRALRASMASHDWVKDGGEYIPKPQSWLNETPWESSEADLCSGTIGGGPGKFDDPEIEGLVIVVPTDDEHDRVMGWGKYAKAGNGEREVSL